MNPQKNSDDNKHFKIGRNVLFNQESIAILEARLQHRFLDVSTNGNILLQKTKPLCEIEAKPRLANKSKIIDKPNHHVASLTLDIKKAKHTPLSYAPITKRPTSPVKAVQRENIQVPTLEELKARKRLSQLTEVNKTSNSVKTDNSRRVMSPDAPPIPKVPSANASAKLIDEFKRKLKTLKVDSTMKRKTISREADNCKVNNKRTSTRKDAKKASLNSFPNIVSRSTNAFSVPGIKDESDPQTFHSKRCHQIDVISNYYKKKTDHSIQYSSESNANKQSMLKQDNSSTEVSSSSYTRKRSITTNTNCVICELELDTNYNLDNNEKIILLKCGHHSHEQCLTIEVELNTSLQDYGDYHSEKLFPKCLLCNSPGIPNDEQELNLIMSNAITNKLTTVTQLTPSTPSFDYGESKFLSSFDTSRNISIDNVQSGTYQHTNDKTLNIPNRSSKRKLTNPNTEKYEQSNTEKSMETRFNIEITNNEIKQNRASIISATPLVVSSAPHHDLPDCLKLHDMWTATWDKNDLLKKFESELLFMFQKEIVDFKNDKILISFHTLIETFGKLRLVDKMEVTTDQIDEKKECFCYLFTNAILFLEKECMKLEVMKINYLTFCDEAQDNVLLIKPTKKDKKHLSLSCKLGGLTKKWQIAITNPDFEFDKFLVTSTIDENEFKNFIRDSATDDDLTNFDNFFINGGIEFLQTGVDTRYYQTDMEHLEIIPKLTNITVIVNQFPYKSESSIHIKNMIRALHMIKIDINLILSSSKFLKLESYINDKIGLKQSADNAEVEKLLQAIDNFEANFYDETNVEEERMMTLNESIHDILIYQESLKQEECAFVLLSNSSLINIEQFPSTRLLMLEVGLMTENKSYKENVVDTSDWQDVMEIICTYCNLDFEEEDFGLSNDSFKYSNIDILASSPALVSNNFFTDEESNYNNSTDSNRSDDYPQEVIVDSPAISFPLKFICNNTDNDQKFLKKETYCYDKRQAYQKNHEHKDKFEKYIAAGSLNELIDRLDEELLKFSNIQNH